MKGVSGWVKGRATSQTYVDLVIAPAVHTQGLDLCYVRAHLPVQGGATHAQEHARKEISGKDGVDAPDVPEEVKNRMEMDALEDALYGLTTTTSKPQTSLSPRSRKEELADLRARLLAVLASLGLTALNLS